MKVYYQWKYKFCRLCIRNMASGFLRIGRKLEKWQWCHNFPTWRHRQIFGRCFVSLVKFSYWSKFHVNIITGSRVWQFLFIRGWPEIRKSEIPLSEFSTISRRLGGKQGIPNLVRTSLIKCYWMLVNARGTAFTVCELLMETNRGRGGRGVKITPRIHLRVKTYKTIQINLFRLQNRVI